MGWEPADYTTLDPLLMKPVEAGLWKLHETFDGTYIVDDLLDILEIMDVRSENEARNQLDRERKANAR